MYGKLGKGDREWSLEGGVKGGKMSGKRQENNRTCTVIKIQRTQWPSAISTSFQPKIVRRYQVHTDTREIDSDKSSNNKISYSQYSSIISVQHSADDTAMQQQQQHVCLAWMSIAFYRPSWGKTDDLQLGRGPRTGGLPTYRVGPGHTLSPDIGRCLTQDTMQYRCGLTPPTRHFHSVVRDVSFKLAPLSLWEFSWHRNRRSNRQCGNQGHPKTVLRRHQSKAISCLARVGRPRYC